MAHCQGHSPCIILLLKVINFVLFCKCLVYHLDLKNEMSTKDLENKDALRKRHEYPYDYLEDDMDLSIDTSDELYEKPEHYMQNMSPREIQNEITEEITKWNACP
jgi:hypothetical protein